MNCLSVDVAKEIGVEHRYLLEKIRTLKKQSSKYSKEFTESEYVNKRNRKYPCYVISNKGRKALIILSDVNSSRKVTEFSYLKILKSILGESIETQKRIMNKYFLDVYVEKINLVIEINEKKSHKSRVEKDKIRKREIVKYLSRKNKKVYFIEIWENELEEGIEKVMVILKNTNYLGGKDE